jgi:uracil-DNA glycosylase
MASRPNLNALVSDIRSCRICAGDLPHAVRPVLPICPTAKLCIAGPAPAGQRVHNTGIAYADASGGRLWAWLAMDSDVFYDESRIAIVPMGFAFPGCDDSGADKPPRPECAHHWHGQLFAAARKSSLLLAIATCAQRYYLNGGAKKSVTETVRAWREYGPFVMPLPHPSGRNNGWLRKNPWFEGELIQKPRARGALALSSER